MEAKGFVTNLFYTQGNTFFSGLFISVGTIEFSDVEESVTCTEVGRLKVRRKDEYRPLNVRTVARFFLPKSRYLSPSGVEWMTMSSPSDLLDANLGFFRGAYELPAGWRRG